LGCGVWGLGFVFWGIGFGVWDLGSGVRGLRFRVWGLGLPPERAIIPRDNRPHMVDKCLVSPLRAPKTEAIHESHRGVLLESRVQKLLELVEPARQRRLALPRGVGERVHVVVVCCCTVPTEVRRDCVVGARASGLGCGVWGVGFGVWGLGCGAWGFGFWVSGFGVGVWGLGFRVWAVGFGVWGVGCRV
jgi:hypothetical protein